MHSRGDQVVVQNADGMFLNSLGPNPGSHFRHLQNCSEVALSKKLQR